MAILLVVDDDVSVLQLIMFMVESGALQLRVVVASSCEEARRLAMMNSPDILLFDYYLPDGDGLSLLKEMRSSGRTQAGILMSGRLPGEILDELMKKGEFSFISKPFCFTALDEALRQALTRIAETPDPDLGVSGPE